MSTPSSVKTNPSTHLSHNPHIVLSKEELISNAQQLQQLLQIPDTTNDVLVYTPLGSEDRSPTAAATAAGSGGGSGDEERKEESQQREAQRKKIDPNMSTSRIKIAYSASSFSYSEDNPPLPLTTSSNSVRHQPHHPGSAASASASASAYCTLYAQRHQQKILHHLEIILSRCEEIEKLYLTGLSQFQINIPATMTAEVKAEWSYLQEKIKRCVEEERERGVLISMAEYQTVLQLIAQLFTRPKHEVYLVLRDDSFARYNKTRGFDEFIVKMRPYLM
jgi:hypothetical protein